MFEIQYKLKQIIALLTVIIMLSSLLLPNISIAATAKYTQTVKSGISSFPKSYQSALKELQEMHPNWTFDAYYTGIDWNTFIHSQTCSTTKGISLIWKSAESSWKCSCGYNASGYYCASEGITAYYADPRNFLNEVNIFQFSEYTYNSSVHKLAGVKKSVKNTFLDDEVTFKLDGEEKTMTYAEIIMDAAKASGMSPYSIRTKIIQEVGTKGSNSVSGNYSGYKGYYNFFNYGAYDNAADPIVAALKYAKDHGWNNQYTAIVEGAKLLADSYTSAGQNTPYFYKWDVVGTKVLKAGKTQTVSTADLFKHQYMTNIQDPYSQSSSLWNIYNNAGILDEKINFVIPVYENMPSKTTPPTEIDIEGKTLYYADVDTTLNVRSTASMNGTVLKSIAKDTKVIMLERKYKKADGYDWDKIQLSDGTIGYAVSIYLAPCGQETTDVAATAVSLNQSNLYLEVGNGSNITKSTLKATITPSNTTNKIITWSTSDSKIAKVSGGTVTAVAEGTATITAKTSNGKKATCKVTVTNVEKESYPTALVNADVLNVRKIASTKATTLATIYENDWVKVLEPSALKDDKYEWSKIQTSKGVVGYVANEFITVLEDVKLEEKNKQVLVTPNVLAKDVCENNENIVVTDADGNKVTDNTLIGTGFVVKNKGTGKEYVVVKKGDITGDGEVKSADYVVLKNCISGKIKLSDAEKKASDANNDGEVKSADYVLLKNYIANKCILSIK